MSVFQTGSRAASLTGPATLLREVAPDDARDLPEGATRSLFVGVGGDVSVVDSSGVTTRLASASNQYHPIRVVRVLSTGTTAAGIVALY